MHLPNMLLPGPTRLRLTTLTATTERIILDLTATQTFCALSHLRSQQQPASIATTSAPWPICRGPVCLCSFASTCGASCAATSPVRASPFPSRFPRWLLHLPAAAGDWRTNNAS